MRYARVINEAWHLTVENPAIKWFVFVPSIMALGIFLGKIITQIYLYLNHFDVIDRSLIRLIWETVKFLGSNGLMVWAVFGVAIVLLFWFVIPPWVSAVTILCVRKQHLKPEGELRLSKQLLSGFGVFFKMFELNALLSIFSIWSIVLFSLTLYRYYHDSLFGVFLPILIVYGFFALVVNFFLSFAPYGIICKGQNVQEAVKESISLVFLHLNRTLAVWILVLLIQIRVLINVLVIVGVPVAIVAAVIYGLNAFWITLLVLLGIVLFLLAAYITAILEVFMTSVWIKTYYTFVAEKEVIEADEAEVEG